MICESCGVDVQISDWPFCPHGATRYAVHGDEIPGGMWVENGFAEPIKVYSHSEHRARLAAEGLEIRAKWAGENDRHLTRWDTVDLEGAKAALERQAARQAEKAQRWKDATIKIIATDGESFTGKDLGSVD